MLSRVVANILPPGEHRLIAAVQPGTPPMYDVEQVVIEKTTDGAARTVVIAIHTAALPLDEPLMVANADQLLDWDIQDFLLIAEPYDGCIVTFPCPERDPKWSYARLRRGLVIQVAEKSPISNCATAGVYYWARTEDFLRSATDMIAMDERTNGEFYVAPTYNYLVRDRKRVIAYQIARSSMHGLGTPEDLALYLESRKEKI